MRFLRQHCGRNGHNAARAEHLGAQDRSRRGVRESDRAIWRNAASARDRHGRGESDTSSQCGWIRAGSESESGGRHLVHDLRQSAGTGQVVRGRGAGKRGRNCVLSHGKGGGCINRHARCVERYCRRQRVRTVRECDGPGGSAGARASGHSCRESDALSKIGWVGLGGECELCRIDGGCGSDQHDVQWETVNVPGKVNRVAVYIHIAVKLFGSSARWKHRRSGGCKHHANLARSVTR